MEKGLTSDIAAWPLIFSFKARPVHMYNRCTNSGFWLPLRCS